MVEQRNSKLCEQKKKKFWTALLEEGKIHKDYKKGDYVAVKGMQLMRHSYSDRIRKWTQKQNSGVEMGASSKKLMDHFTKRKGLKMNKGLHSRIKESAMEKGEDRECDIR